MIFWHILHVPVVEDIAMYKGNGPLAGLLTGMEFVDADWYIVAPCYTRMFRKNGRWHL